MNSGLDREVQVFNEALQLPAPERSGYLDRACQGDAALRQAVDLLLQAHQQAGEFLRPTAAEPAPSRPESNPASTAAAPASGTIRLKPLPAEKEGDRIGRYRILQEIGEGGCGAVYMAQQEEPVRRRVALKVIKLGMDTRQVIARFEAERQALALMDHPNIAKVLDAGATEAGRLFFVMELVRGIKITEYCDQNKLPMTERLKLFVQICHAVQHAHQKGIIHRDIKPSNILVTLHDGVPVPKVIDFGIAKATTDVQLTDKTMFTRFEQFIGTPAYMSPEQAEMSGLDIDTRSDIYSLGVLLYELLVGRTPFDQKQLMEAGLDGMRRMIREQEPARPSTRLSSLQGDERTTTALRRGADAPKLIHLLRGDLDWIVMKCLEKDRTRRYETANGLALDIQRHLNHEPIVARPPSNFYRFQKTVERNKLMFAAAGVATLALLLGAIISSLQAVRASRAEAAARHESQAATKARQQAEAVVRFLTEDLLYQATPDQNARERKVTMEEVLDRASRRLDQNAEVARGPEIEATLRLAVGSTYYKLGLVNEAEPHLRAALSLRRIALGPEHPQTLAAQAELADFLAGGVRKFQEAEELSEVTWKARHKLLGPEHADTVNSLSTYIHCLADQRKLGEAERLQLELLRTRERLQGSNHFQTIGELGNLAYILAFAGKIAEAEYYEREELARFQHLGYMDRMEGLYGVNNLALFRFLQGDPLEAERLLVEARPRARRVHGPENLVTLHIQHVLARVLAEQGRLNEAEQLAWETLEIRRRVTPTHEGLGRILMILGVVLVEKGELDKAQPLLAEALALFQKYYPLKTELSAEASNWLGAIKLAQGNYAEAESLLVASQGPLLSVTAFLSPNERRKAIGHLVKLYEAWGKPDQAILWQQKLDQLAPVIRASNP
jgi:serine/threonine protein kinase/tetratricopeptide (TPR) repeat protein